MNQKTKLIAGLVALCLVSAVIASLLTAAFMMRELFGYRRLNAADARLSAETDTTPNTSEPVSPSLSPAASVTPEQPAVSPVPSAAETASISETTEKPDEQVPASEKDPESEPENDITGPTETSLNVSVPASPADEQLQLWQDHSLIEDLYTTIRPCIVGISVVVDETVTSLRRTNEGSGLIMSEDGYIVTNSSIISIAVNRQGHLFTHASIFVYLDNFPRAFMASLVGRDPLTGLAVLKIDPGYRTLQPAPVAEAPYLKVGQMIVAVSYPDLLEESGSLYTGLISSLDRPVQLEDGTSLQMIQTDARISQRSSGGPLLNLSGEVIGIVSGGLSYQSYNDVQSYALPAKIAQKIVEDMTSQGYVGGRAWLGVSVLVEETFQQLRGLYNYPEGLYITNVIDDSPAYIANMRKGDIITSINNQPITQSMDISHFLQSQPVGSLVNLLIYRSSDSQYYEIRVYLQEYKQ